MYQRATVAVLMKKNSITRQVTFIYLRIKGKNQNQGNFITVREKPCLKITIYTINNFKIDFLGP